MTPQLCPACGRRAMTWSIQSDDGRGPTSWGCSLCRFAAEEDESQERDCPKCGGEKAAIRLSTPDSEFYLDNITVTSNETAAKK